jgi:hypothetical protein
MRKAPLVMMAVGSATLLEWFIWGGVTWIIKRSDTVAAAWGDRLLK